MTPCLVEDEMRVLDAGSVVRSGYFGILEKACGTARKVRAFDETLELSDEIQMSSMLILLFLAVS